MTVTNVSWTRTGHAVFAYDLATNWSTDVVPNDILGAVDDVSLTRAGANYTVAASAGYEINALTLNANATLRIDPGSGVDVIDFAIDSYAINGGTIDVQGGVAAAAVLVLGKSSTTDFELFNSGAIDLDGATNAATLVFSSSEDTLDGAGVITLSGDAAITNTNIAFVDNYDNTIQGGGSIFGSGLIFANATLGTIDANAATPMTIDAALLDNAGTIETTGAGGLIIQGSGNNELDANITIDGQLLADGSGVLEIENAFVTGNGVVEAAVAGATILLDDTTLDVQNISVAAKSFIRTETGTTDEIEGYIDNAGSIVVANNSTLELSGDLDDSGTLRLSAGGATPAPTVLALQSDSEIEAGASLILSNSGANFVIGDATSLTLTNAGAIEGAGTIGGEFLALDNRQAGVIDADDSAGLTIVVNAVGAEGFNGGLIESTGPGELTINGFGATVEDFTNAGTIDDANAAVMTLNDIWFDSGQGTIETTVAGATIELEQSAITTGVVSIAAGSSIDTANATVDLIETEVINSGAIAVGGDSVLIAASNWFNVGSLVIDGSVGVEGGNLLTLLGGGMVDLGGGALGSDDGVGGVGLASFVNLSDMIQGFGTIGDANFSLTNSRFGVIDANDGALSLTIYTGTNAITNAGTIESIFNGAAAGSPTLAIESDLDNAGVLTAGEGSWIDASAGVQGLGLAKVNGNGELELGGDSSINVVFNASGHGILRLDDSVTNPFSSLISGFHAGDTIDLSDVSFIPGTTSASFFGTAAQGELTISDNTHSTTLHLIGDYLGTTFTPQAGQSGVGTAVTI